MGGWVGYLFQAAVVKPSVVIQRIGGESFFILSPSLAHNHVLDSGPVPVFLLKGDEFLGGWVSGWVVWWEGKELLVLTVSSFSCLYTTSSMAARPPCFFSKDMNS